MRWLEDWLAFAIAFSPLLMAFLSGVYAAVDIAGGLILFGVASALAIRFLKEAEGDAWIRPRGSRHRDPLGRPKSD